MLVSGSTSLGTAKSTINIGSLFLSFSASATIDFVRIGSVLPVQVMTMSASVKNYGSVLIAIASPL